MYGCDAGYASSLPPPMFFVSPTGVPSCLKPEAQHAPGALEAILDEACSSYRMCKGNSENMPKTEDSTGLDRP